jgi:hypothetical protein
MITYREKLGVFKEQLNNNLLIDIVKRQAKIDFSESESKSMKKSLTEVSKILDHGFSDQLDVGIEYNIPLTSRKRIDFLINGLDEYGNENLIIIELKTWQEARRTEYASVIQFNSGEERPHPSWQAYSYASIIKHFNEAIEVHKVELFPLAFLHEYKVEFKNEIYAPVYQDAIKKAPIFISDQYPELRDYIRKYIKSPSKKDILYEIENGKIKPSKMLIDSIANMLQGNDEYVLLDEQKVIHEKLFSLVTKATSSNDLDKHVIIVEGGAGTGKSLIAINLLSKLLDKGKTSFYVSKSSYIREAYFKRLVRGVPDYDFLKTLFKSSGDFIQSGSNDLNVLIVDEAHRLSERTKRSYLYYGENQVKEIINAAKVSIFFIDEKQNIDIKDIGTIEEIKRWAKHYNAKIHYDDSYKLKAQFRCKGSNEYIEFLDHILYNTEPPREKFDFEIKIFDDMVEMQKAIIEKNKHKTSRILSGDVFPWVSRNRYYKNFNDIKIGDFQAQWNKHKNYAANPLSINEVGCIHTSQGMEFDYVGVIIGDDLIYRNGRVLTDYTKHPSKAGEFRRPHKQKIDPNDKEIIDRLIRNTYRVLFQRGLRGAYLYVMDSELKVFINSKIDSFSKPIN